MAALVALVIGAFLGWYVTDWIAVVKLLKAQEETERVRCEKIVSDHEAGVLRARLEALKNPPPIVVPSCSGVEGDGKGDRWYSVTTKISSEPAKKSKRKAKRTPRKRRK
jgi:hypothetical protein